MKLLGYSQPVNSLVQNAPEVRVHSRQFLAKISMLPGYSERVAGHIDVLTDRVGRWSAWLVLVVIVLLFVQLPLREVFGAGHILANDFGQIVHAAVFMFGLSYALRWDRHVRMDVFHRRMNPRA